MIVDILKKIYSGYGIDNDAVLKITGSVAGGNKKKIAEAFYIKPENLLQMIYNELPEDWSIIE